MSPSGIRTLWEVNNRSESPRGYLIGPGDVYGGDYAIYPTDDPSTSHAVATISVVTNTVTPTV
jgi:tRNA splicing endonuclease